MLKENAFERALQDEGFYTRHRGFPSRELDVAFTREGVLLGYGSDAEGPYRGAYRTARNAQAHMEPIVQLRIDCESPRSVVDAAVEAAQSYNAVRWEYYAPIDVLLENRTILRPEDTPTLILRE